MQMSDEQHAIHHVNYVPEHELHHISNGDVMDDEHDEGNGVGESEAMEGDAPSDPGSLSDNRAVSEIGDQLTLSFQGQVYVFDSVSPEKVIFGTVRTNVFLISVTLTTLFDCWDFVYVACSILKFFAFKVVRMS